MQSIKLMLLGIALIVFGIPFVQAGHWLGVVCLFGGMIISVYGFIISDNETRDDEKKGPFN